MAISDVSLTSGMRANLTALQGTVTLLNRTQQRLSTGKAVNSALDNAINYFSAQSLNTRASDLAGYKDGMANAVQTIQAADKGISGITTLLNSAKAIASSVAGQPYQSASYSTVNLNVGAVANGETFVIDGITVTVDSAKTTGQSAYTIGVGTTATATLGTSGATAAQIATQLKTLINNISGASSSTSGVNTVSALGANGGIVSISDSAKNLTGAAITGTGITSGDVTATTVAASNARSQLTAQYNQILTQIDKMASDSSFNGVNLLQTGSMTVNFGNSNSLAINGNASDSISLGLAQLTTSWNTATDGSTEMNKVDTALATMQSSSQSMSSSLSIIHTRSDFSTNLIGVLQTGADNLTLADTNQEGANMLMLQTRQSLGTTALSLSSQAAQSVLRLFQ